MMEEEQSFPVLILEDSLTQAVKLQLTLEAMGYAVTHARNGTEGLRLLRERFFPIVISDWIMPEMDGAEFCKAVRNETYAGYVYILLLTAKDSRDDLVEGLEAGADDYLIKPVHPAELSARLKTAGRILALEGSLRKRNEEIARLSITDPLTGAYNRRYLTDSLSTAVKRAIRYGRPLSVVLCDIDHFKQINDRYGHQTGDRVLQLFTGLLMGSVRQEMDWVCRFGGEEFVIVLPETGIPEAAAAAERYRSLVASRGFATESGPVAVTASFGTASVCPGEGPCEATMETLLATADRRLYQAKAEGRNRCVSERKDEGGRMK